jgi:hypothetical protein
MKRNSIITYDLIITEVSRYFDHISVYLVSSCI